MPTAKKSPPTKTIIILVVLALAAVATLLIVNANRKAARQEAISLEQQQQKLKEKVSILDQELASTAGSEAGPGESVGIGAESGAEGEGRVAGEDITLDPCKTTTAGIDAFFTRLDQEDYIADLKLEGGSKVYFTTLIDKLMANRPNITRETDNLLSILQNAAHFYRVLGEKNIFILKKIMALEKGQFEPVMANFYSLIVNRDECKDLQYPIQLPMDGLYSYSAFFLNTLGGQSYLFRREPAFRTLVKYYCVLVLDQANMKNANPLGIDIRYPINSLIEEMTATSGLENKDKYLDNLLQLQSKYATLYGAK